MSNWQILSYAPLERAWVHGHSQTGIIFLKSAAPQAVIYNGFDEMFVGGVAMGADGAIGTTGRAPAGYGLVGMRERATLLGGTFHAGPTADHGWRVEANLPRTGRPR